MTPDHELIGTWTRKLRSRQQAEDLTHDAFVRVLAMRSRVWYRTTPARAPWYAARRWWRRAR